mgnify:CR=1 FL=1
MSHYVDIFDDMLGQTLTEIKEIGDDELIFITAEGDEWKMLHEQDCCESVTIDDIVGDLDDLIGHPLLQAESVSGGAEMDLPEEEVMWLVLSDKYERHGDESETWTFYKFQTIKGGVNIRWYGCSNGYYSESVSFYKVQK